MNRNVVNIHVHVLCEANFIPRSGIVGHRTGVCLVLEEIAELFSRVAVTFCIPGGGENPGYFTCSSALSILHALIRSFVESCSNSN